MTKRLGSKIYIGTTPFDSERHYFNEEAGLAQSACGRHSLGLEATESVSTSLEKPMCVQCRAVLTAEFRAPRPA